MTNWQIKDITPKACAKSRSSGADLPAVTATNTGGYTAVTLYLAVASPMDAWRQQFFGTAANTGIAADTADTFNTGVPNLLAFAFFGPSQPPCPRQH